MRLRYSASLPKLSGMSKTGMMGSLFMLYTSTLSATSMVFSSASGTSAKMAAISSGVFSHSCLV